MNNHHDEALRTVTGENEAIVYAILHLGQIIREQCELTRKAIEDDRTEATSASQNTRVRIGKALQDWLDGNS